MRPKRSRVSTFIYDFPLSSYILKYIPFYEEEAIIHCVKFQANLLAFVRFYLVRANF